MKYFSKLFFIALTACLFSNPLSACDFDDSDGLDVGLVLSGGGAKASIQVGIMQVLEELEIPIHCVTGTSMGSVVGAFYASGYKPDEIANILTDNDWGALFAGETARRDKSFIEKERESTYFSGNVASIGSGGVKLPGGISSMQGLKSFYRDILSDVPMEKDFNQLSIPYRAIAADLETGETKAFARGDLVESILASMAIPGLFAPREIDGRFYIDGGISDILPVQAARDMGADIIIAINVSSLPAKPTAQMSGPAAAQQLTTIMVYRSLQRNLAQLKPGDLLINPDKAGIATAGYNHSADGLKIGRAAGADLRQEFLAIKAKAAPSRRETRRTSGDNADGFRIENNSVITDELIEKRFQYARHDREDLAGQNRRLRNLASFGGFGEVDLGHVNGDAVLTVHKNNLGRNLVQVGINAASDFNGETSYSLLGRLVRRPLGSHGGDISLSAEFGSAMGLNAALYQPLGGDRRFFVQPEVFMRWERKNFVISDAHLGDFWVRSQGANLRLGREISQWGLIALEANISKSEVKEIVSIFENFDDNTSEQGGMGVFFAIDTLNRTDWPTAGLRLHSRAKRNYSLSEGNESSDEFTASALGGFSYKDFGIVVNGRFANSHTGDTEIGLGSFRLGGFRRLAAFSDNSLPLDSYEYGSVEVFRRLSEAGKLFDLPLYIGGIAEYGHGSLAFFTEDGDIDATSGTLYLGADTPLGPVFLGGAYGNSESGKLFFKFGRTF
ncbi:MAG: patatin-like phospholipase family protein [Robiginitomaculum sp.]